ncbi:hypothetical protein ANANG_G00093770 [Anguilla anguilla]|uniref:Large subunit GTPase 1 homolog n=1 Tax=Anguilla anguilla TaxID=7936 RepID=A0A9D3MMB0_ANGAN|nr:hypothetical protein ANANG_G00093770 [Anguilla anguilla]
MGKKKSGGGGTGLGRALIKERLMAGRGNRRADSWLHTSELNDGYDWGRLNLQSVTEQSSLDDFLATAELAGTEFIAEKLNIKFVPAESRSGLLTSEETKRLKKIHEENKQLLRIPRRPEWDQSTSPEALQQAERDSFLEWRRELATLEEDQNLILTPYERNLDFWRQLWRVIERSDLVVQIVDARHPSLFRCPDLERYVKEASEHKENMVLVNKADLLTREQRRVWARHFEREGIRAVFWSALAENARLEAEEKGEAYGEEEEELSDEEEVAREDEEEEGGDVDEEERRDTFEDCVEEGDWQTCSEGSEEEEEEEEEEGKEETGSPGTASFHNSSRLLSKDELLALFKTVHSGTKLKEGQITVGLVGYPNVGKSSTINTLLRNKKVSVSATPGHTKHFQTLFVEPGLCLCDCPGLVMPSFVSTKADMICSGILPIDQMRDHHHSPARGRRPPAPAHRRGTAHGLRIHARLHDHARSARPIPLRALRAEGLRLRKAAVLPPSPAHRPRRLPAAARKFDPQRVAEQQDPTQEVKRPRKIKRIENTVDKDFFHRENVRALTKGVQCVMGYKPGSGPAVPGTPGSEQAAGKPWKKHGNRNKKEKVRRLTKHLDA